MFEEEKIEQEETVEQEKAVTSEVSEDASADESRESGSRNERRTFGSDSRGGRGAGRGARGGKGGKPEFKRREREESDDKISVLSIRRVAKVGEGSKRLSFAALVVVGDGKGSFGIATGKSRVVSSAIQKAVSKAKKLRKKLDLLDNRTLHYDVTAKFCASKVVLRKAQPGTGIKAGKIIRAILECLGGSNLDIVTKILGSNDPRNVANAVQLALSDFTY